MRVVFVTLLVAFSLFAGDMTLEIVKEVGNEPKISIENASINVNSKINKKFFKLIKSDLIVTSHFNVDENENVANFDDPINYPKYKDSVYLLRYRIFYDDFGKFGADAVLYDLKADKKLFQKRYTLSEPARYPFVAHKIVYDINEALHFPDVSFLRSFVIFSKYVGPRRADIYISDYTLTYQKKVVSGGLNLFPKWADKEQRSFYYTAMSGEKPTLYKVDIYRGTKERILSSEGMLVCSDVSEDGRRLLLTMAPNMQPDIYIYDLATKRLQRVTYYKGIDVNGNFVQNDRKVVFVSDRLGYPTIFAKRIGSRAVERLVYHGRNNSACTTYGDYVAYSSRESDNAFGRNTFNLYLISTTSDYIRRLTANGVNIFPRFAKDGETLLFIKEYKGQTGLGVIRLRYNKSYVYPLYTGKIQSIDW